MSAHVLAVGGSYRAGGNTDVLLSRFARGAEEAGTRVRTVFLRDLSFTSCIGCELCAGTDRCLRFEDDMSELYPLVEEAHGLILASPAYNYNVTSVMKAFVDRLYPFYNFTSEHPRRYTSRLAAEPPRRAAVLAVCEQLDAEDMGFTPEAMARPLTALGYEVTERVTAFGFFEKGAIRRDPELLGEVAGRGRSFGKSVVAA